MKIRIVILFSLMFFFASTMAQKQELQITQKGKSKYTIIIPNGSNDQESKAASLLQEFIFKSSGCVLKILTDSEKPSNYEIVLGKTKRKHLQKNLLEKSEPDEFHVFTSGKSLFIQGGEHKGIVYGVIDFVEKYLECFILAPDVEKIKTNFNISIPQLNYTDKPANTFRIVHGSFNNNASYKDWMRLDNIDEMFADGYYVHTFNRLVPWEKFFDDFPDYYAYMNGKHIIDQLCMSNPEVLKRVIERLRFEMAKQPDKKVWSVSQNDNFSYCQCDKCMRIIKEEGSPSGPLIRFVNKVAQEFPDKTISTLAYQFSRQAPLKTKPAENVQVMLCTIELNRSKSIEQDPQSASFVKDIEDWGKISKDIYLWDYTVDFAHSITPFPNLHVLQPNIQFLTKNGAKVHFQQTNTAVGHEMSELKAYLLARLLWNPDVNIDSVKNVFIQNYYGKAGPFIRKYIDQLESELIKSGEWLDIYGPPVSHENSFLSGSNMALYQQLFDDAEKAVADDYIVLQRVKVARLPIMYAQMEIGKNDMFGQRGWYTETGSKFILKDDMRATLENFYTICKENKVQYLNESGLTPESYYKATLRFIDVKTQGNLAFRKPVKFAPAASEKYSKGNWQTLTNGVQGANDYKVHWLGWENKNVDLILNLEKKQDFTSITIGSLWDPKSWILHPKQVSCMISGDGITWDPVGTIVVDGNQKSEEVTRNYNFKGNFVQKQYVRFLVSGTLILPSWHPSAGGLSWVFLDEIIVE